MAEHLSAKFKRKEFEMLYECFMFAGDHANVVVNHFGSANTLADILYTVDEWEMTIVESGKFALKAIFTGTDSTSRILICH